MAQLHLGTGLQLITEVKNSGGQEGHTGTERASHLCKPGKTWQGSTYEANTGSKGQGS